MDDDDLVEQVARAIYDSHQYVKHWDRAEKHHAHTRKAARAAIAIMRRMQIATEIRSRKP